MKFVISPAKTLDLESPLPTPEYSLPLFSEETEKIEDALRKKSVKKLEDLMSISKALARLNYERNQTRVKENTPENARPAVYMFKGDVYLGLDAYSLSDSAIPRMQKDLRILSGLYGLLKPLDLIQPYRLEMGTSIKIGRKKNLYHFWGKKIAEALNEEMEDQEPLINLASQEYFSAVDLKALKVPVITPVFKDFVNGYLKVVSFHAKKARGMMVRYLLENEITGPEAIKAFNYEGYAYDPRESTAYSPVFIR